MDDELQRLFNRIEASKRMRDERDKASAESDARFRNMGHLVYLIASMPSPALMALNPNISKEFLEKSMREHTERTDKMIDSIMSTFEKQPTELLKKADY